MARKLFRWLLGYAQRYPTEANYCMFLRKKHDPAPTLRKCRDCGNVGMRAIGTRELLEIDDEIREHGFIRDMGDSDDSLINFGLPPLCAVHAFDLPRESPDPCFENWAKTLDNERPCGMFCEWQRGFSPKEHVEMLDHARIRAEAVQMQKDIARASRINGLLCAAIGGMVGGAAGAAMTYLLTMAK